MKKKLSKTQTFQRDVLLGPELRLLEEQNKIDKARYRSFLTPQKRQINSIHESVDDITKEIESIELDMSEDEFEEYRYSKIQAEKSPIKPEPIEYTLLRDSIKAAISNTSIGEEEDYSDETESEVSVASIDKNIREQNCKENAIDFSRSPKYNQSPIRNMSKSLRYEDLCSSEDPNPSFEMEKAIEASEKARVKLNSPYMTKIKNIRPLPPQSPSVSYYRSKMPYSYISNTSRNSKTGHSQTPNSKMLSQNYSPFQTEKNYNSIMNFDERGYKTPSSSKKLMSINGVKEHIERLKKTPPPPEDDETPEIILPNKPLITPNLHQLATLYSKEIDDVLEEINGSLNKMYE